MPRDAVSRTANVGTWLRKTDTEFSAAATRWSREGTAFSLRVVRLPSLVIELTVSGTGFSAGVTKLLGDGTELSVSGTKLSVRGIELSVSWTESTVSGTELLKSGSEYSLVEAALSVTVSSLGETELFVE